MVAGCTLVSVKLFLKITLGAVIVFAVLGFAATWMSERGLNQQKFTQGKVPDPLPDGLYAGFNSWQGPWIGKEFDAKSSAGINVFKKSGAEIRKYPFKISVDKGLRDDIEVLKVDYNHPDAPFWLRPALDEIVEIAPGRYLGKLHFRIPGLYMTLGYFILEKEVRLR